MSLTRTVWPDKILNPSYNNSFILDNSTGWTHTYSAINGDIFVYTAKDATYNSTGNVGTAFVFEKDDTTGWKDITTKYKLVPSDTSVTNFGNYVVMDSNNIIITQENYNSNRGAVYVYQKNNDNSWGTDIGNGYYTESYRLSKYENDAETNIKFGEIIQLSGNYLAITSRGKDDNYVNAGVVDIYKKNNSGVFEHLQTIKTTTNERAHKYFGIKISFKDGFLAVSSSTQNNPPREIEIFKNNNDNWTHVKTINYTSNTFVINEDALILHSGGYFLAFNKNEDGSWPDNYTYLLDPTSLGGAENNLGVSDVFLHLTNNQLIFATQQDSGPQTFYSNNKYTLGHIGYFDRKSDGSWGEKYNDLSGNFRFESKLITSDTNDWRQYPNSSQTLYKNIAVSDDKIIVKIYRYYFVIDRVGSLNINSSEWSDSPTYTYTENESNLCNVLSISGEDVLAGTYDKKIYYFKKNGASWDKKWDSDDESNITSNGCNSITQNNTYVAIGQSSKISFFKKDNDSLTYLSNKTISNNYNSFSMDFMSDDYLLVGAYDNAGGNIYIYGYNNNTWSEKIPTDVTGGSNQTYLPWNSSGAHNSFLSGAQSTNEKKTFWI